MVKISKKKNKTKTYVIAMFSSPFVFMSKDRNVLENFHAAHGFEIMLEHHMLEALTKEEKKNFRQLYISCVLATDLALHVEITGKWNNVIESFDPKNKEHRALLAQILIKASDISNPAKRFDQAKYWAYMIQEEFFIQVSNAAQQTAITFLTSFFFHSFSFSIF